MQVSARVHYGCLAMLELALRHDQDRPVSLREIVARQGIPQPFLVQILQSLRSSGLVTSTRGSSGGYRLAMAPEQISLITIAESIGCGDATCSAADSGILTEQQEAIREVWARADEAAREVLAQTKLSDLVACCAESSDTMFYI